HLKELIQFMDAPQVLVASPDSWQQDVGVRRLAALFVSAGLPKTVQARIFDGVAAVDCNVPLVLVGEDPQQADKAAPWARILHLPAAMQIDKLSAVLDEVWAVSSTHRPGAVDAGHS